MQSAVFFYCVALKFKVWWILQKDYVNGVTMRSDKELMGASTTLLVLGVLAREASYGYEVVQKLSSESEGVFEWQEGTVYPVLHRLEKDGLVRAQWQDADASEGGRRRKYYYITAKGRKTLATEREQWEAVHRLVRRVAGDDVGLANPASM